MSPHLYSNKSSLNLLPSFSEKKNGKKGEKNSPELKVKKINV